MSDPAPSVPPSPERPAPDRPAEATPQPQPAPPPQPRAQTAREAPPADEARWNPLQTPLAWIVVALHLGLYVAAVSMSEGHWDAPYKAALLKLGYVEIWTENNQAWRWFASLFLHGMIFNAVICIWLLWSLAPALEKQLRTWRFAVLYVLAGLGASLTRELLNVYVSSQVAASAGNGGRSAAFALLGSIGGIYLGLGAVRQAVSFVIGRVGYYAVMILLVVLLAPALSKNYGLAIDLWGVLSDMVVGSVCGLAVALTLHRGGKRLAGFALVTLLVAGVGGEAGWLTALAKANRGETDSRPPKQGPRGGQRRVDENKAPDLRPTPTPSPRTSMPDEDPPEIAKIRAKARALLDPLGPLPAPAADADTRASASRLAQELVDFDNHWTGHAAANLDLEIGQLELLDHQTAAADRAADTARAFLVSPRPPKGSPKARRLAQAYGTLGLVALEQGKTVEATNAFTRAVEADALLPEPHFYLGKLLKDADRRKAELKVFVDLAGPSPPPSQADLLPEAKELLGS